MRALSHSSMRISKLMLDPAMFTDRRAHAIASLMILRGKLEVCDHAAAARD